MGRWDRLFPLALVAAPAAVTAHASDYLSAQEAQRLAYPDADRFEPLPLELTRAQIDALESASKMRFKPAAMRAWRAYRGEHLIGWFFVDAVLGKHEMITYSVALDARGRIIEIQILQYRESFGGEVRSSAWRDQFHGKSADDSLRLDDGIKNVAGATLSCRHVTDGVRRIVQLYRVALAP